MYHPGLWCDTSHPVVFTYWLIITLTHLSAHQPTKPPPNRVIHRDSAMGGISPPMGMGQMRRGGGMKPTWKGGFARKFCDSFKGHFLLNDLLKTDTILEAFRAKKGSVQEFWFRKLQFITIQFKNYLSIFFGGGEGGLRPCLFAYFLGGGGSRIWKNLLI